jgi:hypothetical protein
MSISDHLSLTICAQPHAATNAAGARLATRSSRGVDTQSAEEPTIRGGTARPDLQWQSLCLLTRLGELAPHAETLVEINCLGQRLSGGREITAENVEASKQKVGFGNKATVTVLACSSIALFDCLSSTFNGTLFEIDSCEPEIAKDYRSLPPGRDGSGITANARKSDFGSSQPLEQVALDLAPAVDQTERAIERLRTQQHLVLLL